MGKVNSNNSSDSIREQKNTELNKLRLVFEQTPGAIFILDKDFKFEYVNPSFTNLSGYSQEELLGRTVAELFYHKDLPESRNDVVRSLLNGEKWQGELLTFNKNGSTYWANTIAAPYRDESSNIDGYVVIQQDITEKRRMQVALVESEKFYRTLIESSMDAVSLNQNGQFLLVNSAFCAMFGYTNEEIFSMVPESFIAPEDRERVMDYHYKRMQGGIEKQNYTANFLHKSGKRVLTELNATTVQVNGQNASFITMHDITARTTMEIALRESEAKYKTLVENSQDGIIIIRDDKILFVNNTLCNVLGYTCDCDCDLLMQMPSINLIYREDRYKVIEIAKRRQNQDFSTISEIFRMVAKDGSIRECETLSTLIEFDGQWASFFTIHDVTDSRRMQQELKESEEKYRQLFAAESDAIFMIDAETGQILDANPATTSIYGYSHSELLNMKNTDVSAEPEKTKTATENLEMIVPHRLHKRKDGTIFPVELSAGFTKFKNKTIQIVTSRDITERIKTQEALAKSEQKYRELADFLPQTVYELDNRGNLLYMNKSGMVAFGLTNADFGLSALDSFIPEDRERMIENLKMTAIGKRATPMNEYTAVHRDGSTFPVMIYGVPMIQNGISIGTRGMIVDISDRKTMENALRDSESKYKTLIENSQDGIFAIVDDKMLFANNTFCNMLGYTPEELYDKSAVSLVFPEDRVRGLAISERRKQGDHSTVNDIFRFIAKDGSLKAGDVFSSVLELNGQVVSYITVHDLTETRRMQEQLQQSEEKYRTVIEKATDGIVITQLGKLMFVNNRLCQMLQYSETELVGMPFIDLTVEEDRQVMNDFHKRRMAGEDFTALYRSRIIRKDGKILTVELNARTSDYNGNPAAFIIIRDISDRIKIENELQTAKIKLELLNTQLEKRVKESSESLTEARTQLINLQKENLQSQFDVLKQQVNPHFLFNSLNVLTSLIKLEPDLAEKFSEQLSKVYRYVLENKDNELVDLNTELNFLDAYIFLLNIRFVDKLRVNINISTDRRSDRIIPLAMQLLIENAIKHNIMSKSEPLSIDVFIDEDNFLNIINNLQERPSQLVSTGVGLKNIQNRYLLLNNTEPVFEKTESHFIAKVPLVLN
jgi:PAS domain S-box-containing protein